MLETTCFFYVKIIMAADINTLQWPLSVYLDSFSLILCQA